MNLLARRLGALTLALLLLSQGVQWCHVHPPEGMQTWQGGEVGLSAAQGHDEACPICWAHQALQSNALVPHVIRWEAAMVAGCLPEAEIQGARRHLAGGPRAPPTA